MGLLFLGPWSRRSVSGRLLAHPLPTNLVKVSHLPIQLSPRGFLVLKLTPGAFILNRDSRRNVGEPDDGVTVGHRLIGGDPRTAVDIHLHVLRIYH